MRQDAAARRRHDASMASPWNMFERADVMLTTAHRMRAGARTACTRRHAMLRRQYASRRRQHSILTTHRAISLQQYSTVTPQHCPFTPQDACREMQHASCTAHAPICAQQHHIATRAQSISPLSQRPALAKQLIQHHSHRMQNVKNVNCAAAETSLHRRE